MDHHRNIQIFDREKHCTKPNIIDKTNHLFENILLNAIDNRVIVLSPHVGASTQAG